MTCSGSSTNGYTSKFSLRSGTVHTTPMSRIPSFTPWRTFLEPNSCSCSSIFGYRCLNSPNTRGKIVDAVIGGRPIRILPRKASCSSCTLTGRLLNNETICCARSCTMIPASVSSRRLESRYSNCVPNSSSKFLTISLMEGCETCRRAAALLKLD